METARAVNVIAFKPEHVGRVKVQPNQAREIDAESLASPYGSAWTALHDGDVLACAGVLEVWPGRAYAWALLSADAGPHMLALTREIRSRLATLPFRRVEMAVDAGFVAGARWARLLGFECETPAPMRQYLPGGRDAFLFARVKHGNGNGNDGGLCRDSSPRRDL